MNKKYINFLIANAEKYGRISREQYKNKNEMNYFNKVKYILKYKLNYVPYMPPRDALKIAMAIELTDNSKLTQLLNSYSSKYSYNPHLKSFFTELAVVSEATIAKQIIKDSIYLMFEKNNKYRLYTSKGRNYRLLRAYDQLKIKNKGKECLFQISLKKI